MRSANVPTSWRGDRGIANGSIGTKAAQSARARSRLGRWLRMLGRRQRATLSAAAIRMAGGSHGDIEGRERQGQRRQERRERRELLTGVFRESGGCFLCGSDCGSELRSLLGTARFDSGRVGETAGWFAGSFPG